MIRKTTTKTPNSFIKSKSTGDSSGVLRFPQKLLSPSRVLQSVQRKGVPRTASQNLEFAGDAKNMYREKNVLAIRDGAVKGSVCIQPKTQDSSSEKYGVKEADASLRLSDGFL